MKSKDIRRISVALVFIMLGSISLSLAQTIPWQNRVNWSVAGLWTSIPTCADAVFQVNLMAGASTDDQVENAYNQARSWINQHPTSWAIVYFPEGTYDLHREIYLDASYRNIIFQGAGSNKTTLKFLFWGTNQICIHLFGTENEGNKRTLATDLNKGSRTVQCTQAIGYTTPCWVRLCEEDHPYCDEDGWAARCVGQITRLIGTNGTVGTLKDSASKQYTVSRHTSIWPITPVMNIGFENLKIWRMDDDNAEQGGYNIFFEGAVNCWVKGVRFEQTCRNHIWIARSSHIYISGCFFHDARSHGLDGNGYGVALSTSTTNCLVENNNFDKLRHAMLVQAGSNCNVFAFNIKRFIHR